MADSKNTTSQTPQGSGPLGQSGVSPSGTVQRSYHGQIRVRSHFGTDFGYIDARKSFVGS